MPSHLQTGWDLIQRHQCNRSNEAVCEQTTRWLAANADAIGVRIPNASERVRAMGLQGWVEHLGLSEYEAFNATGNAFDGWAQTRRIVGPVESWVVGGPLPRHDYPAPAEVWRQYRALSAAIDSDGLGPHVQFAPWPRSMHEHMVMGDTVGLT